MTRALLCSTTILVALACGGVRTDPPTDGGGGRADVGPVDDGSVDAGPQGDGGTSVDAGTADLEVARVRVVTTDGGRLDWGPDGRLAFDRRHTSGDRRGLYDIYVSELDGADGAPCLTCDLPLPPGHRGNPAWHPSGEWILFQVGAKVGNRLVTHPGAGVANELWAVRPDGTDLREIFSIADPDSFDGSLHPHFDHDGDRITFARFRGLPEAFEVNLLPFDADDPALATPTPVLPDGDARWPRGLYETHGFTPDDRHLLFTADLGEEDGFDLVIVDPETRDIVDRVTDSPTVWDEHAHFQPGTTRILYSSGEGLGGTGSSALDSRLDWWVREADGAHHRLTAFNDPDWPLRHAERVGTGTPIEIGSSTVAAGDGTFSPDGRFFAGVLIFRGTPLGEWIVVLDLE